MKKTIIAFTLAFLTVGVSKAGVTPVATSGKGVMVEPGSCLTYDFIDLDYGVADNDSALLGGGERWGISFSKSLGEVLFLTGGYTNTDFDYILPGQVGVFGFDSDRYSLGLGGHWSLAECVDLTFEGGGDYRDAEFGGNQEFDYDSWGYYVGPGIRARAGRFEAYAKVFYTGREGVLPLVAAQGIDNDGWVFAPGMLFHLTDHLALKVAADVTELDSAVTVGARINF